MGSGRFSSMTTRVAALTSLRKRQMDESAEARSAHRAVNATFGFLELG